MENSTFIQSTPRWALVFCYLLEIDRLHSLRSALQFGAATSTLDLSSAVGGVLSFKKLGLIHFFPEQRHGTLKKAHRTVSWAAEHALHHSCMELLPVPAPN